LAATEDAIDVAHSYGIATDNADYFVADDYGTRAMGQSVNSYAGAYRAGGQSLRLQNEDKRVKGKKDKQK
jgi:hypothetical protein